LEVTALATNSGVDGTTTRTMIVTVDETTTNIYGAQAGETLNGTTANNLMDGLAGDDTIDGGAGNDMLFGGAGNDSLMGGDGNDVLDGGAGADTLVGGIGNDLLIGGKGNDVLTGGIGVDVFKWELTDAGSVGAAAADTITDFDISSRTNGGDVLDLRDLLVGENITGGVGNLANYLHFEKSGSDTIVHVSSNGAYSSGFDSANDVQTITLQGVDLVTGFANDQAIIQNLVDNNKLITD
jgi:Ca2+-binding RTX toxin-like protein